MFKDIDSLGLLVHVVNTPKYFWVLRQYPAEILVWPYVIEPLYWVGNFHWISSIKNDYKRMTALRIIWFLPCNKIHVQGYLYDSIYVVHEKLLMSYTVWHNDCDLLTDISFNDSFYSTLTTFWNHYLKSRIANDC